MRDHRIPLVFLEACQSAQAEDDPTASVAAKLLEEGVTSVVAMSHRCWSRRRAASCRRSTPSWPRGAPVGTAMLAGQQALLRRHLPRQDHGRGRAAPAGLVRAGALPGGPRPAADHQAAAAGGREQLEARAAPPQPGRAAAEPPPHHFQGRSRELLALERLLHDQPYAVVRGQGGAGKTTLAAELARWLVRTGRFRARRVRQPRAVQRRARRAGQPGPPAAARGRQLVGRAVPGPERSAPAGRARAARPPDPHRARQPGERAARPRRRSSRPARRPSRSCSTCARRCSTADPATRIALHQPRVAARALRQPRAAKSRSAR